MINPGTNVSGQLQAPVSLLPSELLQVSNGLQRGCVLPRRQLHCDPDF